MTFLETCGWLLKEIIAPRMCCHCGKFFTFLCQDCYERIDFSFSSDYLEQQLLVNTPFLDKVVTVGSFNGPLKSLVLSLKYQGQIEVAYTLAALTYHTTWIPDVDMLTFVPAHLQRIKQRGFNQSQLIAEHLALHLHKPCGKLLVRSKKLVTQASIHNKQERRKRQQNTMQSISSKKLKHKTILLIDDVFTTGATLNEAARVLKEELDAKSVVGLTIAQA